MLVTNQDWYRGRRIPTGTTWSDDGRDDGAESMPVAQADKQPRRRGTDYREQMRWRLDTPRVIMRRLKHQSNNGCRITQMVREWIHSRSRGFESRCGNKTKNQDHITITEKEIREDFERFVRHEAMRANTSQEEILKICTNRANLFKIRKANSNNL